MAATPAVTPLGTDQISADRDADKEARAQEIVNFADTALALAGHEVTDPYLRKLLLSHARNEISGDEARERGRNHILGR